MSDKFPSNKEEAISTSPMSPPEYKHKQSPLKQSMIPKVLKCSSKIMKQTSSIQKHSLKNTLTKTYKSLSDSEPHPAESTEHSSATITELS